ncbi:MOSC domain-containing protein [Halorarius litoreus]|uniref:MOSC domain-containing protein n=1 Tax=Halorarius litoreus TaxID=2962676 RepID=UPI0020CFC360|nr:MOSC N-terminal beta barrel domain-containing protein [Halorarius litoreus]
MTDPTLASIFVHPIKSLDPVPLARAEVLDAGGLSYDREYVIVDANGNYVTGKRERETHRLASSFDPETGALTLGPRDGDARETFSLPDEREAVSEWLAGFLGYEVELQRDTSGGFPDDTHASGPTVIAQATIEVVADWFDDIDPEEMRRRLRPNLVVEGVDPFWEDRLYADRESVVAFDVGDARFEGVNPCQRCAVPTRDPDTGETTEGFRERFVQQREVTLPEWANRDWFDHHFRLMVNTHVPRETVGQSLGVGDPISLAGVREA